MALVAAGVAGGVGVDCGKCVGGGVVEWTMKGARDE